MARSTTARGADVEALRVTAEPDALALDRPRARDAARGRARRSPTRRAPRAARRGRRPASIAPTPASAAARRPRSRVGAEQRDGAIEEADLAGQVAARRAPHAPPPRAAGPPRVASSARRGAADLALVAAGGLEVEADPRVGLRQLGAERRPATRRGARAAAPAPTSPATRRRPRARGRGGIASIRVRPSRADEQVAPDQALARLLELGAGHAVGERVHLPGSNASPTIAPSASADRSAVVEPVQARGEQRVERGRKRFRRRRLLLDVGDELLEEERVAAGRLGDPPLARPAPGARPRSPRAAPRWPRAESGPSSSTLAATRASQPGVVEHVAARHPDDQHGRVAQPRGDVDEQVQQRRLGQVRVVDHQRRAAARARAPRSAAGTPSRCPRRRRPPRARPPPPPVRPPPATPSEAASSSIERSPLRLLDDLAQRPVRHAAAVRRAAAGQHPCAGRRRRASARRRGATCRCRVRRRSPSAAASRSATTRANASRRRRSSASRPMSGRSSRRRIAGASASKPRAGSRRRRARRRARRGARGARSARRSGSRRAPPPARAARRRRPPRR